MLNKVKSLLIVLLIFSTISIFLVGKTGAADETIACDSNGCSGITGPIFSETNLSPDSSITKTLTAQNNYPENRDFLLEINTTSFSDSTPAMGDVLSITITEQESSNLVYGPKTLSELKDDGEVTLSNIPSGEERNYDLAVVMDDAGNDYQGKSLTFDLTLGFEAIAEGTAETSGSTSSEGEVLGASTGNTIGSVLGLSATSQRGLIYFYLGTVLIISGLLYLLISLRRKERVRGR